MSKKTKVDISDETVAQALKIAKANQAPGQSKEVTRQIAKGIEKGISQYKAQEKARKRERDKAQKRRRKTDGQPKDYAPHAPDRKSLNANETPLWLRILASVGVFFLAALPVAYAFRADLINLLCSGG